MIGVGFIAAFVSVFGFSRVSDILETKFNIADTCGVHNLHGMPGILGGIVSAIAIAAASTDTYEKDAFDKSFGAQAAFQLLGIAITLAIAIVGGWITGRILRYVMCFVWIKFGLHSVYRAKYELNNLFCLICFDMFTLYYSMLKPQKQLFQDIEYFDTPENVEAEFEALRSSV